MAKKKSKAQPKPHKTSAPKTVSKSAAVDNTRWIILAVVLVLVGGLLVVKDKKNDYKKMKMEKAKVAVPFDFANSKVVLDNREVTFLNGAYKQTSETGEHTASIVSKTLNPAGNRAAAIIMNEPGGSGSFYYVVGAMKKDGKETFSAPMLLGDRIQIQSVTVDNPQAEDNGMITVMYLDHAQGTAMAEDPTMTMSKKFSFEENGNLIEVLQ